MLDGEVKKAGQVLVTGRVSLSPAFQGPRLGSLILAVNRLCFIGVRDIRVFKSYLDDFFQKPQPFCSRTASSVPVSHCGWDCRGSKKAEHPCPE